MKKQGRYCGPVQHEAHEELEDDENSEVDEDADMDDKDADIDEDDVLDKDIEVDDEDKLSQQLKANKTHEKLFISEETQTENQEKPKPAGKVESLHTR